jgi:hypothetical protein
VMKTLLRTSIMGWFWAGSSDSALS